MKQLYEIISSIPRFFKKFYHDNSSLFVYALKRILLMIPVFLVITFVIFLFIQIMPGDPLTAFMNPEDIIGTPEQINARRQELITELGLDKNFITRYFYWWRDFFQGDLGYSVIKNTQVEEFIGEHLYNTFKVNIIGFFLAFFVGIIVGITSAVKKNGLFDKFFTVFSVIGFSMPSFFSAMLIIYIFSAKLSWLPFGGMSDINGIRPDWHYLVLPVMLVTIVSVAQIIKYMRNAMLEVLKQDYIRTAYSKGLSQKIVIYKHAFKNSLIPVITLIGFWIPALFGGSIVTEKIFNWSGIGLLMNQAYSYKDRSVLIAVLTFYAFLTLIGNLFMDLGYAIADPKVRVGKQNE